MRTKVGDMNYIIFSHLYQAIETNSINIMLIVLCCSIGFEMC